MWPIMWYTLVLCICYICSSYKFLTPGWRWWYAKLQQNPILQAAVPKGRCAWASQIDRHPLCPHNPGHHVVAINVALVAAFGCRWEHMDTNGQHLKRTFCKYVIQKNSLHQASFWPQFELLLLPQHLWEAKGSIHLPQWSPRFWSLDQLYERHPPVHCC